MKLRVLEHFCNFFNKLFCFEKRNLYIFNEKQILWKKEMKLKMEFKRN